MNSSPDPVDGRPEPVDLNRLQQVIDRVHLEGLDRVPVESCDENDVGIGAVLEQPPGDLESCKARHLDVQKNQVRPGVLYRFERVQTVGRLGDDVNSADLAEQVAQFFTRQSLVVHDDDSKGLGRVAGNQAVILEGTTSSGMTTRAQVPSPGTLSSCN